MMYFMLGSFLLVFCRQSFFWGQEERLLFFYFLLGFFLAGFLPKFFLTFLTLLFRGEREKETALRNKETQRKQ